MNGYVTRLMVFSFAVVIGSSPAASAECVPSPVDDEASYTSISGNGPKLAPFSPTPLQVVEKMLSLAQVTRDDVVYDLGSGDGRILIAAAKKYGARAVGFEIDPHLVQQSRAAVRKAGVDHLVEIRDQDLMTADLSQATVVTLYLVPEANNLIQPWLQDGLRPNARVVSNEYGMDGWEPETVSSVLAPDQNCYTIFLWRVDER